VHGQTRQRSHAAALGTRGHAGENEARAGGGNPTRDPAVRTLAAEGEGDRGAVADSGREIWRGGAADVRGVGGVAGGGSQDGECRDGAGVRRAGVSGGHAYSPAGAAVEINRRKERRADGGGFEETVSTGAVERVAPADHFLRTRALHGTRMRRDGVRDLPNGGAGADAGGEDEEVEAARRRSPKTTRRIGQPVRSGRRRAGVAWGHELELPSPG